MSGIDRYTLLGGVAYEVFSSGGSAAAAGPVHVLVDEETL